MNQPEASSAIATDSAVSWKRLSPMSMVFFLLSFIRQLAGQSIPALIPIVVGLANAEGNKLLLVIWGGSGLLALIIIFSILSYLMFRYRIDGEHVLVNSGVLHRSKLNIKYSRIQNVNIKLPFYMRPLNLAVLSLDTAGSAGKEVELAGIPNRLAEEIRDAVLLSKAKRSQVAEDSVEDAGSGEEELLAEVPVRDLVRYGLSSNLVLWLLVFAAPATEPISAWIQDYVSKDAILSLIDWMGGGIVGKLSLASTVLFALLVVLVSISVLAAIVRYYGFKLTRDNDTFKRRAGLLTTHEESLNQSKIQTLVRQQNFIARWLKRCNLVCKQVTNNVAAAPMKTKFLVPALSSGDWLRLAKTVFPDCQPDSISLSPISRRYIWKTWLGFALIPAIPAFALWQVSRFDLIDFPIQLLIAWAVAATLLLPLVYLRWRRYGYAVDGDFAYVQTGFIGSTLRVIPLFKVQRVEIRQSLLQRRSDRCNVSLYLASGHLVVPYIPRKDAQSLLDIATYHVETTEKEWI